MPKGEKAPINIVGERFGRLKVTRRMPNNKYSQTRYSEHIQRFHSLRCTCGDIVSLNSHTNICPECGRMYNAFGQELAPVDEWDPDDAYDTFGPQNEEDW